MTVTRRGPRRRARRPSIGIGRQSLLSNVEARKQWRDDCNGNDRRGRRRQHRLLCRRHAGRRRPQRGVAGAPARDRRKSKTNGLRLTSFEGFDRRIAPNELTLSEDPAIFGDAGVVLVTVKSADTAEIADLIAQHAPSDAVIVSLQNGVGNVAVLRERLPGRRVLAGMVPFNVIALGRGPISSRHFGRHRHRAGRRRHRGPAFGARPEHARAPQHRRRAMGQAAGQSQQRAQRAGRPAAAPAAGAARLAQAVRRPDGGGAGGDQGRGHPAGVVDADPGELDARLCCGCPTRCSRCCWGGR